MDVSCAWMFLLNKRQSQERLPEPSCCKSDRPRRSTNGPDENHNFRQKTWGRMGEKHGAEKQNADVVKLQLRLPTCLVKI